MSGPIENEWVCPKPGCVLDIDAHDFALALEHIYSDAPEFTAADARDVAERTLDRVARAFCDHTWSPRGTPGDRWRECWLCGKQEDA